MSQEDNNKTVKKGMILGLLLNLVSYSTAYFLLPKFDGELLLIERMELGLECLIFPAFFMLVMVIKVGAQRYGNSSENPTLVKANTESMKVDLCVLSNTTEQLILFCITTLGLSIFLPVQYLSLLPIYSGLFVVGRIIFFLGYHYNILWRAPGFAMAAFPVVLGLLFCCISVLSTLFT